MQNKFRISIAYRLFFAISTAAFAAFAVFSVLALEGRTALLLCVWTPLLALFLAGVFQSFTCYEICGDYLHAKPPLLKGKTIRVSEIVGWYLMPNEYVSEYVFVAPSSNMKIPASGKLLKKALEEFTAAIHDELADRGFRRIHESGCPVYGLSSRPKFTVGDDGIVFEDSRKTVRWGEVRDIDVQRNGPITFYTIHAGRKIRFSNVMAKGCIGLDKYFREKSAALG